MPLIRALSLRQAEDYAPPDGAICISINERGLRAARLSAEFADVLRLVFDDVTAERGGGTIPFAPSHARQILEFVGRHPRASEVVVHCTYGQSRSTAVCLALHEALDTLTPELEERYSQHNPRVRRVLREALARSRASTDAVADASPAARQLADLQPPSLFRGAPAGADVVSLITKRVGEGEPLHPRDAQALADYAADQRAEVGKLEGEVRRRKGEYLASMRLVVAGLEAATRNLRAGDTERVLAATDTLISKLKAGISKMEEHMEGDDAG